MKLNFFFRKLLTNLACSFLICFHQHMLFMKPWLMLYLNVMKSNCWRKQIKNLSDKSSWWGTVGYIYIYISFFLLLASTYKRKKKKSFLSCFSSYNRVCIAQILIFLTQNISLSRKKIPTTPPPFWSKSRYFPTINLGKSYSWAQYSTSFLMEGTFLYCLPRLLWPLCIYETMATGRSTSMN